jgi:hypothetical protein
MPAVRGAILAACEIRLRAERKAGQLCAALERSNPGKRKTDLAGPVPPKFDRLRNAGISEDQARVGKTCRGSGGNFREALPAVDR